MQSGCDRCGRSKRERGIAQLAEHRSPKPKVGGSIPSAPAPEHFSVVCSVSLRARSFGALTECLKNDPIYGESFLFRGSPYNRRQSNACIGGAPCSAWNLCLYSPGRSGAFIGPTPLSGGFIAGGGVALFSPAGKEFIGFTKDSWREVRKVVWPTRQEAGQTTLVVFGFVLV